MGCVDNWSVPPRWWWGWSPKEAGGTGLRGEEETAITLFFPCFVLVRRLWGCGEKELSRGRVWTGPLCQEGPEV